MAKRGSADQDQPQPTLGRLEANWDEPPPAPGPNRSDHERLQGAWSCTTGRRRASFLVCGNRFAIHFADGDIYMGSFELGPAARPRTMIVKIEEGPPRHKGLSALCAYEFVGDTLRWWTAGPDRPEPPAHFPADADPTYLCLVLQRETGGGS